MAGEPFNEKLPPVNMRANSCGGRIDRAHWPACSKAFRVKGASLLPPLLSQSTIWEHKMRKVLLAFVAAASLAGCSWMHHDEDRNMQGSGTSTPYTPQARAGEDISPNNTARTDWNRCDQHPYMPGPARKCE